MVRQIESYSIYFSILYSFPQFSNNGPLTHSDESQLEQNAQVENVFHCTNPVQYMYAAFEHNNTNVSQWPKDPQAPLIYRINEDTDY